MAEEEERRKVYFLINNSFRLVKMPYPFFLY